MIPRVALDAPGWAWENCPAGKSLLLVCDDDWRQMRALGLQAQKAGVSVIIAVKVTWSQELRQLVGMIDPYPLIQHRFIARRCWRIRIVGWILWLWISGRLGQVSFDKPRTFHWLGPWIRLMGIQTDLAKKT